MRGRLFPLLAGLGLTLLAGCNFLIEGDYSQVTAHQEEDVFSQVEDADYVVTSPEQIENAVMSMVRGGVESGVIRMEDFAEEDAETAFYQVIEEVAMQPMYAYAVNTLWVVSFEGGQAFTDVTLFITYQKSVEQIEGVRTIYNGSAAATVLEEMVTDGDTYLAMLCPTNIANVNFIQRTITDFYYQNPLEAVLLPGVVTGIYPSFGSGTQRVAEVELDFGHTAPELAEMRREMTEAAAALIGQAGLSDEPEADDEPAVDNESGGEPQTDGGEVPPAEGEEPVAELAPETALALDLIRLGDGLSTWSDTDSETEEREPDLDAPLPGAYTAYGALVERTATSEGFAMAFKAICDLLEIECHVVQGEWEGSRHVWNIISLGDDTYYHMDISLVHVLGPEATYLTSDAVMMLEGSYSWDASAYPRCEGGLSYQAVMAALDELLVTAEAEA